jgi:5-methylcytosine-specific restriction endonuclease McrA
MPKKDVTAGELLCTFVKRNVLDGGPWQDLTTALSPTGRGAWWAEFVEEVVATQFIGRLVTAGRSIAEELGGNITAVGSIQFRQQVQALISDTTLASLDRSAERKMQDLVERAVRATFGSVSEADRKILRDEATRMPRCYLCNQLLVMRLDSEVEPSEQQLKRAVAIDHVWPRMFGGDTVVENLALACRDCNNRKANYANWAMVDVQSLVLGYRPSTNDLERIPGWRRFAMLSYAAHRMADAGSLSLKTAHQRLQNTIAPAPRVKRMTDVADFFNLTCQVERA